jgi:hypothetical protein
MNTTICENDIQKAYDYLEWFVEEDETAAGYSELQDINWDEVNAYWLEGKRKAQELLTNKQNTQEYLGSLLGALCWYLQEDETQEGGEWEDVNAYWLTKNREILTFLGKFDLRPEQKVKEWVTIATLPNSTCL